MPSIGIWKPELTNEDAEAAKTLRKKPPKSKPTKVTGHETVVYNGIGVIGRLLSNDGLLGDEIEPGVWTIKDPLDAQHTKGEAFDGSTLYYAPTSIGHYLGTIYCLHTSQGHQNKSSQDWLRCWSQPQIDSAREAEGLPAWNQPKPIRKTEGAAPPIDFDELKDDANGPDGVACKPKVAFTVNIKTMADACIPVIGEHGIYFDTDGRLVRITNVSEDEGKRRQIKNYAGTPIIRGVERDYLRELLSDSIDWVRIKSVKGELVESPTMPPGEVVGALLARGTYTSLDYLIGVKTSPFFRPDGSICTKQGYDEQTGYFLAPSSPLPTLPECPSLSEAKVAITELLEVFQDFPHATQADKLVPIAAILTILARPAIDGPTPAFLSDANRARVGKGLQSSCIAMIATGRDWPSATWTDDDAETKKVLDGWALDHVELCGFDDIEPRHEFNNPTLRSLITKTVADVRRLGFSGNNKVVWTAVMLANGNKMRVTKEMQARVLRSTIESTEPHPEDRTQFAHCPLLPWVRNNQQRLLRAALVVLRAWFVAGRPQVNKRTLGSFESWVQIIPQCIEWVTGVDVLQCVPSVGEVSEEETFLARLVEALRSVGERTAAQLYEIPNVCELVKEVSPGKNFTTATVGYALRALKRQAVDLEDGRFWIDCSAPGSKGGVKWRVARVNQAEKSVGDDGGSIHAIPVQILGPLTKYSRVEDEDPSPIIPNYADEPALFSAEELESL
jgi:hypothetical protein